VLNIYYLVVWVQEPIKQDHTKATICRLQVAAPEVMSVQRTFQFGEVGGDGDIQSINVFMHTCIENGIVFFFFGQEFRK
jgi:hypothetical protein